MISDKIIPAHILRLFIWEVLKLNTSMNAPVNGLIPILPIEDEPKVADSGKAYIIYGYSENESGNLDQIRRGVFSARIMAPTFGELVEISNVLGTTFESRDIATEAVNQWSSAYANGALTGIRFTKLITSYIEGGEASDTEGGPVDGVVNISYEYVTNLKTQLPAYTGLWS
jgi:hypothetical protein